MPTALITGASAGLGRALAVELAHRGWRLVIDARGSRRLDAVSEFLTSAPDLQAIAGDVTDPDHRLELARAVDRFGSLDLLVNNASRLGPTPLPALATLCAAEFADILATNTIAPLALTSLLLPALTRGEGTVVNVTSDAAAENYPNWGGYGASKAALDHLTATFAVEYPRVRFYAVDPGDLRTEMQQAAFPGEDISDRPQPESVLGALFALIHQRPASGRYRAADFADAPDLSAVTR